MKSRAESGLPVLITASLVAGGLRLAPPGGRSCSTTYSSDWPGPGLVEGAHPDHPQPVRVGVLAGQQVAGRLRHRVRVLRPERLVLGDRQPLRRPVDLAGAGEHDRRLGRLVANGLQQVDRHGEVVAAAPRAGPPTSARPTRAPPGGRRARAPRPRPLAARPRRPAGRAPRATGATGSVEQRDECRPAKPRPPVTNAPPADTASRLASAARPARAARDRRRPCAGSSPRSWSAAPSRASRAPSRHRR